MQANFIRTPKSSLVIDVGMAEVLIYTTFLALQTLNRENNKLYTHNIEGNEYFIRHNFKLTNKEKSNCYHVQKSQQQRLWPCTTPTNKAKTFYKALTNKATSFYKSVAL